MEYNKGKLGGEENGRNSNTCYSLLYYVYYIYNLMQTSLKEGNKMRDWMEIIDELLKITEKYEEVMTNEDLEELSKLRNEYFIQYYN